jgi:hypothetical protein
MNDFWTDNAGAILLAWAAFLVGLLVGATQF